jgi:hypothetical protein
MRVSYKHECVGEKSCIELQIISRAVWRCGRDNGRMTAAVGGGEIESARSKDKLLGKNLLAQPAMRHDELALTDLTTPFNSFRPMSRH